MPTELLDAIKYKQRPKPNLRLGMIRIICSSVYEKCENPGKNALQKIAKAIVSMHPESFGDIFCGEVVCGGYASLTKQLVTRFQNVNRGNTFSLVKRKRHNEDDLGAGRKKICQADQYGCINWQPAMLPDSETHISQDEKREEMKKIFQRGPQNYESSGYLKLLHDTYFTQRVEINQRQPTGNLLKEWPLLFSTEGFFSHFNSLVGINIKEKLNTAIINKGHRIAKYLETKPAGCNRKSLELMLNEVDTADGQSAKYEYIIFLLMAYFGEKRESLFITADNSTTAHEVRKMRDLPSTPCLIICGETAYSGTSYILCVDHVVINEDISNFDIGLFMLFASFYCLNIQYPHTAAATLEFIQRCFLNINPDSGSKVNKDIKKKYEVFNVKVLTLLKGVADFEWISK